MSEHIVTVKVDMRYPQAVRTDKEAEDVKLTFYPSPQGSTANKEVVANKYLLTHELLFGFPQVDTTKTYKKTAMECLINLLHEFATDSSLNNCSNDTSMNPPMGRINNDGIPVELMVDVRACVNTLQYIINSSSWREGKAYEMFDKFEIDRKLRRK